MDSSYNFQQSPLISQNSPSNSLMLPNSPPYSTSPISPPKSPLMPPNLPPKSPLMPPNLPSKSPSVPPRSPLMPPTSPYMSQNLPPNSPYMPPGLPSKSPYTSPNLSPSNPASIFPKSSVISSNSYGKSDTSHLTILIETEEEYLIDLKCLLQRVTASWNNEHPPPKKLDGMFCLIDKIYRGNREFFHKLKKFKNDPQSSQSLVDILMNWIDKLEKPYTNYCQGYVRGIESLPEIEGNMNLQQTLNRQLRNSDPGSSDSMNFTDAIKRIDLLIDVEKRTKNSQSSNNVLPVSPTHQPLSLLDNSHNDVEKRARSSQGSKSDYSQEDIDYSNSPDSSYLVQNVQTLSELQPVLDTTNIEDFITNKPKPMKIDLLPPRLPFNRELILSGEFTIVYENDESDNSPQVSVKAKLFLLTDLLLICQILSPDEKQFNPSKDYCLLFPPFSGRHLSIIDNYDEKRELIQLNFMQKKDLIILAENREQKEMWLHELNTMINFTIQAANSRPTSRPTNIHSPPLSAYYPPNLHSPPLNAHYPQSMQSPPLLQSPPLNPYNPQDMTSPRLSPQYQLSPRLSAPQNSQSPQLSEQTPHVKKSLSTGNLPGINKPPPPTGQHMSQPPSNYGQNELNVTQYERFPRTASIRSERLREVEQKVMRLMEAKCKVFLQKDHGVWKNYGWGDLKLDLESPSRNKRIIIDVDKPKMSRFVDAIVSESGVQKTGKCKVAITVTNEGSPIPSIYMMQLKDDNSAKKLYDYIKNRS
ncbi:6148_t:CDS:2 [Scutellospora calospora]|uniref:6148_t:CDS:1 n=1 Tax=Scutellospora calospora TaxID=85575 RepID=A0ACA9JWY3_9GLOM|nr:6148_t:CDS:2 [Scutellospora calospora]